MTKRVILELKVPIGFTMRTAMEMYMSKLPGFEMDPEYEPVPVSPTEKMAANLMAANEEVVLIRGEVEEEKEEELGKVEYVIKVWTDARIELFDEGHIPKEISPFSRELGLKNIDISEAEKKIPIFHPAYGMKRGEIKIHDGVIIEYLPDTLKKRKFLIAGIPEEYQPTFEINEIIEGNDAEKNARKDEHIKQYIDWYINYIGRNLSLQKRKELEDLYIGSRAYSEKIIDEFTSEKINYKRLIDQMVQSFSNVAQKERLIFSDNLSDLPSHNPLRIYEDSEITPQLIKKMGKIYKDYFNYYLDRSTWENIEVPTHKIAKDVKYYKDNNAFYKYIPNDKNVLYQDLVHEELGGSKKSITYGTTRTTDPPELLWYELRIYTAEHPGPSISGFLDAFKHVSVVAGVWLYQKRTIIESEKTYTRYEENFSHWLIGNGCAGTYKKHDDLILRDVKIFDKIEDLKKEAFGVMPVDGKYYPIMACAYSVGTFFVDWVCQNNANAFTFCKWGICVVPSNYAGIVVYGTFGNKMISPRECWCSPWKVKKGGVPGNRLHSNQVPHADLHISQIFEATAHGEGFGLNVYYNRKKNKWPKTKAKYRSKDIPFNGPSRSVKVEESNFTHYFVGNWTGNGTDDLIVRTSNGDMLLYPFSNGTFYGHGGGKKVGHGFGIKVDFTHYFVGNWTGNGTDDLIVRTSNGDMLLYPFSNGTFYGHGGGKVVGAKPAYKIDFTHYFVGNWTGETDDLIIRTSTGSMLLHAFGNGTFSSSGGYVGHGFGIKVDFTHYFVGNWTGNGTDDLIVRTSNGDMLLYPFSNGTFFGHGGGTKVGNGFGINVDFTHYFVGNWIGNGTDDLIVRTSNGDMLLYPFSNGTFFGHGGGTKVGNGFGINVDFTHYFVGNWIGNGTDDLIVRTSNGDMLLYPFSNGTFYGHGGGKKVGDDRPPFVIADQAEGLGLFDQESKDKWGTGYPLIDKQVLYQGNQTYKAIDKCGIQAHAGYYIFGSGDPQFEFYIDDYPILYLTMKAEYFTNTCLLLMVHDKEPKDYRCRFVVIGKTLIGSHRNVPVGKDYFTIKDDGEWHDYTYNLNKLRDAYPYAQTVRMVQFYSSKKCGGILFAFHFSSLVFKK